MAAHRVHPDQDGGTGAAHGTGTRLPGIAAAHLAVSRGRATAHSGKCKWLDGADLRTLSVIKNEPPKVMAMDKSIKLKGRKLAKGLRFPEGPIALADGSVLLVEIERG